MARRGSSREDAVMLPSGTEGVSIVLPVCLVHPTLTMSAPGAATAPRRLLRWRSHDLGGSVTWDSHNPTAARMKAPGRVPGEQLPFHQLRLLIGQLIQPDTFSAPGGSCPKNLKGYMSHSPERLRGSREDQSQDRFS